MGRTGGGKNRLSRTHLFVPEGTLERQIRGKKNLANGELIGNYPMSWWSVGKRSESRSRGKL